MLFSSGTTSLSQTTASGSCRRRPRGIAIRAGSANPALAAAMFGGSVWRNVMYSLIWRSVMWRPGKLRFLNGVKTRLLSSRPQSPDPAPIRARAVAGFATPVGLRPPHVANPATCSHPD